MKAIKTFILLMAAAVSVQAQNVTKLSASKANDYGLVYSLPTTVVDVTIETEHVLRQPGEFSNYARRYMNLDNAIRNTEQTARVKSVTLTPRGVASTDAEKWLMQFKGGDATYIVMNDANLPVAINTEDIPAQDVTQLPQPVEAQPTPLEVPAASQAVTQEMSQSSSTAKRAELAAQRIFELRESRNELISGQADNTPPDGKSMQLALDNLTAQEAALTAMFAGTEKTWTQVETRTYTIPTEDVKNFVLARVSATDGVVAPDDLSGEPIYISVAVDSRGELPLDDKGEPRKFPRGGVAYTIPGSATVTVSNSDEALAVKRMDVAQLGITFGLDPKLFTSKKAPAFLLLDPTTGGIATLGTKQIE